MSLGSRILSRVLLADDRRVSYTGLPKQCIDNCWRCARSRPDPGDTDICRVLSLPQTNGKKPVGSPWDREDKFVSSEEYGNCFAHERYEITAHSAFRASLQLNDLPATFLTFHFIRVTVTGHEVS